MPDVTETNRKPDGEFDEASVDGSLTDASGKTITGEIAEDGDEQPPEPHNNDAHTDDFETESGAQSRVDSHSDETSNVHGVGSDDVASTEDVSDIQSSSDVDHNDTVGGTSGTPHDHANPGDPQPPEEHGNAAHSETFAVDGDAQPPESHDHAGDELSPESVGAGSVSVTDSFTDPGGITYTGRIGTDTRRSVNQLFVQSARQDFELGLTILEFSDGQFEIFANDDNIEESVGLEVTFGSPLDDAGIAELADGETEGHSQHVEEDFGFLPSSAWVTDDVPELPDGATVEFEIEDENGNVVRVGRDEVNSDVNLSDDIETYGVETRAVLERDTDTDSTPVLDSYSVYLEGDVPDEYLDAEIESTEET